MSICNESSTRNDISSSQVLDAIYMNIIQSPGKFNSAVRRALDSGFLDQSLMDRLSDVSNLDEVITDRITHIITSQEFNDELDEEIDDIIRSKVVNLIDSDSADELLRSVAIIIINSKGFQDMIVDNYCDNISDVTNKLLYTLINNDEIITKDLIDVRGRIDLICSEISQLDERAKQLQIDHIKTRDRLNTYGNDITVNDLGIELTNQEILRIDNKISDLKDELQKANSKIDKIHNVIHENNGDISILDTRMDSLDKRILDIDSTVKEMYSSVGQCQSHINSIQTSAKFDREQRCHENRILHNQISEQSKELISLEGEIVGNTESLKKSKMEQISDQADMYDMIEDIYEQLSMLKDNYKKRERRIGTNEKHVEYTMKTMYNLSKEFEERNKEMTDMFDGYIINWQYVSDYVYSLYKYVRDSLGLRMTDARLNEILIVILSLILLIVI